METVACNVFGMNLCVRKRIREGGRGGGCEINLLQDVEMEDIYLWASRKLYVCCVCCMQQGVEKQDSCHV